MTAWDDGVTVYTYTAAGRLRGMQLPNGVTTQYEYDAAGRLVELKHWAGTVGGGIGTKVLLAHYEYALDAVGNRVTVTETLAQPAVLRGELATR